MKMSAQDVGFCKHCCQFYHKDAMYSDDLCLECAADRASLVESIAVWGIPT